MTAPSTTRAGSANPTVFALRHPITTLMLVVALIGGGALAYFKMRVDIFPPLNTPKIYVFDAETQAQKSTFGFGPGDIVTEVMSFGSSTPIAVRLVGTDLTMVRQHAEKIAAEMKAIPYLRDVGFEQELDYPTVEVEIDREKAGLSGATVEDVRKALVMAACSTRFSNLNYWVDVRTGFDYLVQVQMPPLESGAVMAKAEDIEILPLESVNPLVNLMIRDVATVRTSVRPGELDRDMSQRYLTLAVTPPVYYSDKMAEKQQSDCQQPQQEGGKSEAQSEHPNRGGRRRLVVVGGLLLLVIAGVSIGLAVPALKEERLAQTRARQAQEERDQARKAEAEAKKLLEQALAERQTAEEQRDQARAAEKATRCSERDTKAVLAFLQDNLLAPGRPKVWVNDGAGKDVTLRQAVDAAEAKVAEAFADRPLVEASIRMVLGSTYLDLGDAKRAVPQLKRAFDLREAELGPDDPATGACRNKLARAYRNAGRPDDASRLFNQNRLSPSHAVALSVQGGALLAEKKPFEAALKLRECLAIREKIHPNDWTTFDAQSMLGEALSEQKKYAEAESLLLSGYKGMKQRQGKVPLEQSVCLTKALERLVRLYEAWGKPDQAAKWRKELEAAKRARDP